MTSSFSSTRAGHTMAGRTYMSEAIPVPNTFCWMEISVFNIPPSRSAVETANTTVFDETFFTTLAKGEIGLVEPPTTKAGTTYSANSTTTTHVKASDLSNPFRIVIELFNAESPRACENFTNLCKGFKPRGGPVIYEDKALDFSYKGTFFHKIIPKFFAQCGDLTRRVGGGCNKYSVFGRQFNDENLKRHCDEIGLVGMANNGPNTNGSQFFITTGEDKDKALEGRHVIFGRVVEGLDAFMVLVGKAGTLHGEPTKHIVITDCGVC